MPGIESMLSSSASAMLNNISSITDQTAADGDSSFSDVFSDIYKLAQNTDAEDKQSVLSLLAGDVNDISSVMIDSQKAELALSLTLEVRNKIMDAYTEIMNMQV